MDGSPLAMQFKQFDADGDNKLNPDQVCELLKLLGKNIYKGSVSSAAKMLNYNDESPNYNSLFTFTQFKEFFDSLENPLKHDIWKGKYRVLEAIKEIRDAANKKEESATAAPGAKPVVAEAPFKGDIEITVGPTNQVYDSFIHIVVEKAPKAESKPFIKIVFEQTSNQKAKELQQRFKKFQTSLFDLMKSSDPESAQILDYIHIITNVADTKLNIFVTTSNEPLIELGTVVADFIDQVLGTKLEAKVQFKHQFCVDINKFVDKTSDYSFYHALTKNYHTKLVWNAMNFKESAKEIFKAAQAFKDLQYDAMDPLSILLIGFLHTDLCEASFVFDNAELVATQLESKTEILKELGELYTKVSEESGDLGIFQTVSSFENKVYVEASIGDWKAFVNLQIKDVKELFSSKIAPEKDENPQLVPVAHQEIQLHDLQPTSPKMLSDGSSQKSVQSVNSIKKPKKASTPVKSPKATENNKIQQSDSD